MTFWYWWESKCKTPIRILIFFCSKWYTLKSFDSRITGHLDFLMKWMTHQFWSSFPKNEIHQFQDWVKISRISTFQVNDSKLYKTWNCSFANMYKNSWNHNWRAPKFLVWPKRVQRVGFAEMVRNLVPLSASSTKRGKGVVLEAPGLN